MSLDDPAREMAERMARGPRNNVLRAGEMFEYDRDEVERGEYRSAISNIKSKMCNAVLNNACEIFLIFWLVFFLRGDRTAPIYTAEKYWMLSWIIAQFLSYEIILFAGLYACRHPEILLDHQW